MINCILPSNKSISCASILACLTMFCSARPWIFNSSTFSKNEKTSSWLQELALSCNASETVSHETVSARRVFDEEFTGFIDPLSSDSFMIKQNAALSMSKRSCISIIVRSLKNSGIERVTLIEHLSKFESIDGFGSELRISFSVNGVLSPVEDDAKKHLRFGNHRFRRFLVGL